MNRRTILGGMLAGALIAVFFSYLEVSSTPPTSALTHLEEATALTNRNAPFEDFVSFYATMARAYGGVYAFSLLKTAPTPFGLDTHLLGHSIGDILYEQEGIGGMDLCTHDFRNACSHTMVIGALLEFGVAALPDIYDACIAAPGGSGAYTMCFHGFGHGVLSFNEYDMAKTVTMCDSLGTEAYDQREAIECFGGAIMEIIGGGGHDPEIWQEKRDGYLDPADPFAFCRSDVVPAAYQEICYTYMTPFAYESLGANMARPSAAILDQVFVLCDAIPIHETANRKACFGGQGKEFIGLAAGRNFISGTPPTEASLGQMRDWCRLAKAEDGYQFCIDAIVDSLYWGGENDIVGPITFCRIDTDTATQQACFAAVTRNVQQYITDPAYYETYCAQVPAEQSQACTDTLL